MLPSIDFSCTCLPITFDLFHAVSTDKGYNQVELMVYNGNYKNMEEI